MLFPHRCLPQSNTQVEAAAFGSDTIYITRDTLYADEKDFLFTETIQADSAYIAFKPDPWKSIWMGAVIPGFGQILNRKYWKLPIVYGGFLGCAYAINWNTSMFQTYRSAYRDKLIDKPGGMHEQILHGRPAPPNYESILQTRQDMYRRYRDLSFLALVAYYAITLVDAYVDAQLYDFDISPDLSLNIQPALIERTQGYAQSFGIQCNFRLK